MVLLAPNNAALMVMTLSVVVCYATYCAYKWKLNCNEGEKKVDSKKHRVELKKKRLEFKKMQRRRGQDARAKRSRQSKAIEREALLSTMTEEEQREFIEMKKLEKKKQKELLEQAMKDGLKVVVDLSFESISSERELNSLAKQLGGAYGLMKKSKNPISLQMVSFSGKVKIALDKQGVSSWMSVLHEQPLLEIFDPSQLIYLTPDSPNILSSFDSTKTYVIGGIVDKTILKSTTLTKANSMEIQTARIPVKEHIPQCSKCILNIDTVIHILMSFEELQDWKLTLERCLSKRYLSKTN